MGGSTSREDCIDAGFYHDNNKYGNIDTGMKIFDFHGKGLFTFTVGMLFGAFLTCVFILLKKRLCMYTHQTSGNSRRRKRSRFDSDDDDDSRMYERGRRRPNVWPPMTYFNESDYRVPPSYPHASQAVWAPARFTDVTTAPAASNNQVITPPDPSNPPPALNNGNPAT